MGRQGRLEQGVSCINDEGGNDAARVHAYLHRKEGDQDNAGYWYGHGGCQLLQRQPLTPNGRTGCGAAERLIRSA